METLVVISNLPKKDIMNAMKVTAIENEIASALISLTKGETGKGKITFSFPCDPSITTGKVPLVCKITLLDTLQDGMSHRIADVVGANMWTEIKKQKGKVLVIVKDETGKMAHSVFSEKTK